MIPDLLSVCLISVINFHGTLSPSLNPVPIPIGLAARERGLREMAPYALRYIVESV
jgi:hypothetical protein